MSRRPKGLLPIAALSLLLSAGLTLQESQELSIDAGMHHLGDDATPEWPEAPAEPEGGRLELTFEARANAGEQTLLFRQEHVDDPWTLRLNGRELGVLRREQKARDEALIVPPGMLVDGTNTLVLEGAKPTDDITFGRVRLSPLPLREALGLRLVSVLVTDSEGRPSPARVTVADARSGRVPLYFAEDLHQATRDGVVYTDAGEASFEVPEGQYTVYATRGSEWSLGHAALTAGRGANLVRLALERQVDTEGYVACDTHVHTLTFSGHGDSSVEERMVTLAGEGVELAISTDHNHNTDYAPYRERLGLSRYFTPVVGNEVTTPIGHFNAFPLDPADEVPPYELHDVVAVVEGIRARGAQVVILNHPRWPSHERGPFGAIELDHFTGANRGAWTYPFDAVELINSTTEEQVPMLLFEDWFALLNRGERVSAVGSSDSHTVGDPVGGGRTYVASATDDPARIDVDAACRAIVEGRSSISMGIFAEATARLADGEQLHGMGDLVHVPARACHLGLVVRAPGWVRPTLATLFVNGEAVETVDLGARVDELRRGSPGAAFDTTLEVELAGRPAQDAWAVWVVLGDGIDDGPYWPLHNDYTLAATNPIFLDYDGDGVYRSPRETAADLVQGAAHDPRTLAEGLGSSWDAVTLHALDLMRVHYEREARARLEELGAQVGETRGVIGDYLEGLAPVR